VIVLLAGLPGTGKSTLAKAVAGRLPAVILNKDAVRAALFPPPLIVYSTGQDDFCVRMMLEVAAYLLRRDPAMTVFIDGRVFGKRYQVEDVRAAAEQARTPFRIIECVCREETARRRIEHDLTAGAHPAANRDFALYQRLRDTSEPVPEPKLVIDTDAPLDECAARASAWLSAAR